MKKYYVYEVEGLQILKFTSDKIVDSTSLSNSHIKAINYILSQDCIDKSLLRSLSSKRIGISCACAGDTIEDTP